MDKENNRFDSIPESVKPYLNEIADRLISGHASVMVGSGFSKNAIPVVPSETEFPNWSELGELFYRHTYPRETRDLKFLNVLKLADQVEALFGRPSLNQLLRDRIPDNNFIPSDLHRKLLSLPWIDVFTTNYDTLLERACTTIVNKQYSIVEKTEDLLFASNPRIIKLHGSFSANTKLVITEEDYRKYPVEFAPFVNTVQQSLLENTLCLIGFSGDDPNFLKWIGWLRDCIGKDNVLKIYFINVNQTSEADRKLLEERKINVIDLLVDNNSNGSQYQALVSFFDYLFMKIHEYDPLTWLSGEEQIFFNRQQTSIEEQLIKRINTWRNSRLNYPGWVILPEQIRERLEIFTNPIDDFLYSKSELPQFLDIEFAFEFNWRLEKCLLPLTNDQSKFIEKILSKYWPFDGVHPNNEQAITPTNNEDRDWDELKSIWLSLSLSLLRSYRENGQIEKWNSIKSLIANNSSHMTWEQKAYFSYENVLEALFTLDFPEILRRIRLWDINDSLPFWEAKKAGLLAELGNIEEAKEILEKSLVKIRSFLNLKPIKRDFSIVSQEAYVMVLLQVVKSVETMKTNNVKSLDDSTKQFSDRWNSLKRYNSDPWLELKLFEIKLEDKPQEKPYIEKQSGFDINKEYQSFFLGKNKKVLYAYSFLRFFEDAGFPFRIQCYSIGKKSAEGALNLIAKYTPNWALITLIRADGDNLADAIYSREFMQKVTPPSADERVSLYLTALINAKEEIVSGNSFRRDNFGIVLAQVVPELLSRLCCKCSYDAKLKILNFVLEIYRSDQRNKYKNLTNLVKRLIESLQAEDLYTIIPILLEFPLVDSLQSKQDMDLIDPFVFLYNNHLPKLNAKKISLDNKLMNELFNNCTLEDGTVRNEPLFRVITLFRLGLLETEKDHLGQLLWSFASTSSGFPSVRYLNKNYFLKLPCPKEIDVKGLFKKYVLASSFISNVSNDDKVQTVILDLLNAKQYIVWNREEVSQLLSKISECWDAEKDQLDKDEYIPLMGNIKEKFKIKFNLLIDVLANIVLPVLKHETIGKYEKDTILRLTNEFSAFGLALLRVKAMSLNIIEAEKSDLLYLMGDSLNSNNADEAIDALNAIWFIFCNRNLEYSDTDLKKLLEFLGQVVRCRKRIGLEDFLAYSSWLINNHSSLMSREFVCSIVKSLNSLTEDTSYDGDTETFNFKEKLAIRQNAAYLAFNLSMFFKAAHENVPESVKKWEEVCRSENEFAEVRNQWNFDEEGAQTNGII